MNGQLGEAHHVDPGYERVWRNWKSSFSQREIRWQRCFASDWEYNTAYIGFNNWKANFGHSTYHTFRGVNCNPNNDENLRIYARTSSQMQSEDWCIQGAIACLFPKYCYLADWPHTTGCFFSSSLMNLLQAYIVYDYQWLTSSPSMNPGGLPSPAAYIHFFGHEFGHGMALGDHYGCSPESIMTGEGCTHMVDSGSPPNDVCVPDERMGYGSSRC